MYATFASPKRVRDIRDVDGVHQGASLGPVSRVSLMQSEITVRHHIPGRIRLFAPGFKRRTRASNDAVSACRGIDGVLSARANPLTGTILVHYRLQRGEDIVEALRDALARLDDGASATERFPPVRPASEEPRTTTPRRMLPRETFLRLTADVAEQLRTAVSAAKRSDKTLRPGRRAASDVPRTAWYRESLSDVLIRLGAGIDGLSDADIPARSSQYGDNTIAAVEPRSSLSILASQFTSVPVALLAVSAVASAVTGGLADAGAILVVVVVNAAIGYVTEHSAERIISSLGDTIQPTVAVLRSGQTRRVDMSQLVPGDVLLLEPGTAIAADARLLSADNLLVDESALTGESHPVHKSVLELSTADLPLAARVNMVFRGTRVVGGSGRALCVAIGGSTEIGYVQELVGGLSLRETQLQTQLRHLGVQIATASGVVCGAVFLVGMLRGYPRLQLLKMAISLAVAAIPEGLPTVAITTLAIGIRRMQAHGVLVRQLGAVESLGGVQIMCLDKTGTITVNRMQAVAAAAGSLECEIHGSTYSVGDISNSLGSSDELITLARTFALCSEVTVTTEDGNLGLRGSPTECALVQVARDAGLDLVRLREERTHLKTQYRSEARSFMAMWYIAPGSGATEVHVKGRASEVLNMCNRCLDGGAIRAITAADRERANAAIERMAGRALRILGAAFDVLELPSEGEPQSIDVDHTHHLVWLGVVGMSDPPREGIADVMASFHRAGVRTVMITGDQGGTAQAVARAIGLSGSERMELLDSADLARVSPEVLSGLVGRVDVFSRVSPSDKLQLVQAMQKSGAVVAMTGDGINDSPALRAADVGVAMGKGGTSAAREVASVVLEDDRLETMIAAIEQGRTIYDDIKKAVQFILSTNMSEIMLTFSGVAAGLGESLTPMQLLWINLMTDIFPELALGLQPPDADVLARPPRAPTERLFEPRDFQRMATQAAVITAGAFGAYTYGIAKYGPGPQSSTLAFNALTTAQLLHVLSARSMNHSIFDREHLAHNRYIPLALGGGLTLQALATLIPWSRRILTLAPLRLSDWAVVGVTSLLPLLTNESLKLVWRAPSTQNSSRK